MIGRRERDQARNGDVLPAEVLALVLQRVSLQQRCRSAVASGTWQRAAAAATAHTRLFEVSRGRLDSLVQWTVNHSRYLTRLELSGAGDQPTIHLQQLPCPQLVHLQLCNLHLQLAPGDGQQGVLHACTGLTQLSLRQCCIHDSNRLAEALLPLQNLQQLSLDDLHLAQFRKRLALPEELLQLLPELTHLHLAGWARSAPLQHVSCLTNLRELRLQLNQAPKDLANYNSKRAGIVFRGLNQLATQLQQPQQLTWLQLEFCRRDTNLVLLSSSTRALQRLTGLHGLQLSHCRLQPALLTSMTQLRHLELQAVALSGDDAAGATLALLEVLPQLDLLQHLSLKGTLQHHAPATAYSALTASSTCLQHLDLNQCKLPTEAVAHIFPRRQLLPQLRVLLFEAELGSCYFSRIVTCCPSLERCAFTLEVDEEDSQLTMLPHLQQLTHLSVHGLLCNQHMRDLARLKGLQHLHAYGGTHLTDIGLVWLTTMTQLTHLHARGNFSTAVATLTSRSFPVVAIRNKAEEGAAPDVWSQLWERCQVSEECSLVVRHPNAWQLAEAELSAVVGLLTDKEEQLEIKEAQLAAQAAEASELRSQVADLQVRLEQLQQELTALQAQQGNVMDAA